MKHSALAGTAALFLLLTCAATLADVTPEEVWQNWQDGVTAMGNRVTAKSAEREGDTLVVKGVAMTVTASDGGIGSASLDEMRFQDLGDGTVAVILPESFPLHLVPPQARDVAGAKPHELTLTIATTDAKTIASGTPAALSYQSDIGKIAVTTTTLEADGSTSVEISAKLTGVTGSNLNVIGESDRNKSGSFAAKSFDLKARVKSADTKSDADVALTLAEFGGKFEMTGMQTNGTSDLEQAMKDGLTIDMALTYGAGTFDVTGQDAGQPMMVKSTVAGGSFSLGMGGQSFHYDAANKSVSVDIAGVDSASEQPFTFSAALADFGSTLDIQGMVWGDTSDFPAALKAGLQMQGGIGLGATSLDFSGTDQGKPVKVKAALGSANIGFALDKSKMHYANAAKGLAVTVAAPGMPMPEVSAELGELAFDLAMPMAKSASPAAFAYVTRIVDLKLPAAVWSTLDPGALLPHVPATLIIDVKGMATLTKDLTDDAMALESGNAAPAAQLNALDITQFNLKALGADLNAIGGFTFDNSDMTTFSGMPAPTGKVEISATGVNALIDAGVAMGLVPVDQEAGLRMMLGVFANSDPAKDALSSTLEFKDHHFFANGQKLQ